MFGELKVNFFKKELKFQVNIKSLKYQKVIPSIEYFELLHSGFLCFNMADTKSREKVGEEEDVRQFWLIFLIEFKHIKLFKIEFFFKFLKMFFCRLSHSTVETKTLFGK